MKIELMLDLETLSTDSKACITQISGVFFDLHGKNKVNEEFDMLVSPADQGDKDEYVLDGSTVRWWLSQDKDVVKDVLVKSITEGHPLKEVLLELNKKIKEIKKKYGADCVRVWGNGVAADNVWMKNAYKRCGVKQAWSYRDDMCFRTTKSLLEDLKGITSEDLDKKFPNPQKHNALVDAQIQVLKLQYAYKMLKGKK